MRTEAEVIGQLLKFAEEDERVRAVVMNGSRVNPKADKDIFCDYDLLFVVTEPGYYVEHQEWIQTFGELIMMQQNVFAERGGEEYIFLMLFTDGVRIDLSFRRLETVNDRIEDSLSHTLLDKEGCLKPMCHPSDASYLVARPTVEEFHDTVNDLLWCSTNVAKGLWRDQLPYAKYMLDIIVRKNMLQLLTWCVGAEHEWQVNVGMAAKWLKRYLPEPLWRQYELTYSGADYKGIWDALFVTLQLAEQAGRPLADRLNAEYPAQDHRGVLLYLQSVRDLPKNATAGSFPSIDLRASD